MQWRWSGLFPTVLRLSNERVYNARKYVELCPAIEKNTQQNQDFIHEKSAVARVHPPVHFGAHGAEEFLVFKVHQKQPKRRRRHLDLSPSIKDEHARIQAQQKLVFPTIRNQLQRTLCGDDERTIVEVMRGNGVDAQHL